MDKNKVLELILMTIQEGIHVVDNKGKTIIYNEQMASIENINREDMLNKTLTNVIPDIKSTSTHLEVQKSKKAIINNRQEYFNKKGVKILTLNSTYPILEKGKVVGSIEIAKDITKIRNLSNRIVQLHGDKENNLENSKKGYVFSDIINDSKEMKSLIDQSKSIAKTGSNILIIGESGTGKELFSQSIHNLSGRRKKPYIAENCAAIPVNLLESILFGTKKGSFTGAENKEGLFKKADGGTLVLDEINSMPLELQSKLLRVLEAGTFRPIGGDREEKVNVRIIAIANKDPLKLVKENKFREDLFFRISVINIAVPPLRERRSDIKPLIEHFIKHYEKVFNVKIKGISKETMDFFMEYNWPGNVRELKHVIEGAVSILGNDQEIKLKNLPYYVKTKKKDKEEIKTIDKEKVIEGKEKLEDYLNSIEKKIIKDVLEKNNHNITKSAEVLGLKRQGLQYKIKKYFREAK